MTYMYRKQQIGAFIVVADVDDKGGLACIEAIENMTTRNETTAVYVHCDVTKRSDLARAISTGVYSLALPASFQLTHTSLSFQPTLNLAVLWML
jgi:hypothetical protein